MAIFSAGAFSCQSSLLANPVSSKLHLKMASGGGAKSSNLIVANIANLIRRRVTDKTKQQQLIDELFHMADVNNDGHIQFIEYQMMFKCVEY